jgi:hypothetical protein
MPLISNSIAQTLRLLPRAALITLMLAAPVLAVPSFGAMRSTIIEAPAPKKVGAGFVILMSLQRN